jgi:hypothetical protein
MDADQDSQKRIIEAAQEHVYVFLGKRFDQFPTAVLGAGAVRSEGVDEGFVFGGIFWGAIDQTFRMK